MAQSGYTPILIYASGTAAALPSAANLTSSANGAELALNYADGKLYYKNSSGVVTLLANAATAAGSPPGGSNTQVQYNNSGAFGGSANFVWDNSNVRLGIGTSSPSYLLHAAGTNPRINVSASSTGYAGYRASNTSGTFQVAIDDSTGSNYLGTAYGRVIYSDGAYPLQFATNATERMRITNTGNVGIGTTTPGTYLEVASPSGSGSGQINIHSPGGGGIITKLISQRSGPFRISAEGGSGSGITFETGNSVTPVERMRIDSAGVLTAAAASTVASNWPTGTSQIFKLNGATYAGVSFGDPERAGAANRAAVSITAWAGGGSNYYTSKLTTLGDGTLAFSTQATASTDAAGTSTERMRISAAGGFSVGTTADPGAGAIYATGNITAYYSDARLKDVKGTIANALDKVSSLSGVYYTNNEVAVAHGYTSAETQVGLLAQDVEAVLPEVVKAAPFDLDERGDSKSGEHYKTVQYERIIPLLVEAIKELRAEVKALRG